MCAQLLIDSQVILMQELKRKINKNSESKINMRILTKIYKSTKTVAAVMIALNVPVHDLCSQPIGW